MVKADPKNVAAQVGLIHCLVASEKLDDAQAAAISAIAAQPNSAAVVTAMGDVQFRLGEMPEAERSYLKAEGLDPNDPGPYLGAARVYRAYSLYRRAYDQLNRAHQIAPNDPAVQLMWLSVLPPRGRIAAIQAILPAVTAEDPEEESALRSYLDIPQSHGGQTRAPLPPGQQSRANQYQAAGMRSNTSRLGATGLEVKLNGRANRLALDTGSSGILVRSDSAEKAGLTRIAEQSIGGLGDKGKQTGYVAVAGHIRIGELEFEDCLVRVVDATGPSENDGLIGTDVFGAYLIDIDIPGAKLRLSPLPKRPDEAAAPTALNSAGESRTTPEDNVENGGEQRTAPPANQGKPALATSQLFLAQGRLRRSRDGPLDQGLPLWTHSADSRLWWITPSRCCS